MKNVKTLSSFSNSVIQKGEMKKVVGGLTCFQREPQKRLTCTDYV